jgi:hypothetical protein
MRSRSLIIGLSASAITLAAWACGDNTAPLNPVSTKETFIVPLTGAAERPAARVTSATGVAVLQVVDENTLSFAVTATGLTAAIAGHFHLGDPTVAGGIMYGFYNNAAGTDFNGTQVAAGIITRTGGGFNAPYTFDSLLIRARAGTAYANLHTKQYPGGEIRGQLVK